MPMKSTTNIQALSKNYGKIGAKSFWKTDGSSTAPQMCLMVQDLLTAPHRARLEHVAWTGGKAVLVTSQFSHNLPVSLNIKNTAKNLKLTQVEHACSRSELVSSPSFISNEGSFEDAKCRNSNLLARRLWFWHAHLCLTDDFARQTPVGRLGSTSLSQSYKLHRQWRSRL